MASGLSTLPFTIINAFTDTVSGGNPALVVLVPSLTAVADSDFLGIAQSLNQPITAFISRTIPSPVSSPVNGVPATDVGVRTGDVVEEGAEAEFGIRWFTVNREVPLCGHGALASAKAIFIHSPPLISSSVNIIKFTTLNGVVVVVKKADEEMLEMTLDNAAPLIALEGEEERELRKAVQEAVGVDIAIKFLGKSTKKGFKAYNLVELDVDDLAAVAVDVKALLNSPFGINVFTSASSIPGSEFSSRMFAPSFGVNEDHVCGSAHCLLTPYWAAKKQLHGTFMARMASARGGDLRVTVVDSPESETIKLAGKLKVTMKGQLFL